MNKDQEAVPVPARMQARPRDKRNYIIPYFVHIRADGTPDFVVAEEEKLIRCVTHSLCWICGTPLGRFKSFVVGPMCTINQISSEPPSHHECAEYACKVCPFMVLPKYKYAQEHAPESVQPVGLIDHNPGVALIYTTTGYKITKNGHTNIFHLGPLHRYEWYAQGRAATRDEVMASLRKGLPYLARPAEAEGPAAVNELKRRMALTMLLLPPAEPGSLIVTA